MSSDATTAPEAISSRFVTHWCAEAMPWPPRSAALMADALWNRVMLEFWLLGADPEPCFRLFGVPGEIRVVANDGTCIGVFADLDAALAHGWSWGWWWGVPAGSRGAIGERLVGLGV